MSTLDMAVVSIILPVAHMGSGSAEQDITLLTYGNMKHVYIYVQSTHGCVHIYMHVSMRTHVCGFHM